LERCRITTADLCLLQHDVGVVQGLLEREPAFGELVERRLDLIRDDDLVLVQHDKLVLQRLEQGLDVGYLGRCLLPFLDGYPEPLKVLRLTTDPVRRPSFECCQYSSGMLHVNTRKLTVSKFCSVRAGC